jgi:hypothetical protein
MKGPLSAGKDFFKLSWDKENKLKDGSWKFTEGEKNILSVGKEKEENECVRKKIYMEKVLFMEKMCANKNMKGKCV